MRIDFIKQTVSVTRHKRSEFTHNKISNQFIYLLYKFGFLDRFLGRIDLDALLNGQLRDSIFDVHHIRPLTGGGNSNFTNLCLIDKSLHTFLNRHCFDPALKKIKPGERMQILAPDLTPVALYEDYAPFIFEVFRQTRGSEAKAWGCVAGLPSVGKNRKAFMEKLKQVDSVEKLTQMQVRERWLRLCNNLDPETCLALRLIRYGAKPKTCLTHRDIRLQMREYQKMVGQRSRST